MILFGGKGVLDALGRRRTACLTVAFDYVNSLALVVPIRGVINSVQFWKGECVALKTIRVLTLELRRVNDLAEGGISCMRRLLAQFSNHIR